MAATLVLAIGSCLLYFKYRNVKLKREIDALKREEYQGLYQSAIEEIEGLKLLLDAEQTNTEYKRCVDERLKLLNNFIIADINASYQEKARINLKKILNDRESFLNSSLIIFESSHPEFIAFLSDYGLDEQEKSYCVLFCYGLNSTEISLYLEKKSFRNISYRLRKKLQIDRSETISTFLNRKMKEFDY